MRDQASHPYKTAGKIRVLYISIFKLSERRWEDMNDSKYSLNLICFSGLH
jgi:hypothetical protein